MHCPLCSVVHVVNWVRANNMPSDKINLTHFQSESRPTARKQPMFGVLPNSPARLCKQGMMHIVSFSNGSHESGSINQEFIRSSGCMEVGQQIRVFIRSSYLMLGKQIYCYCSTQRQKRLHSQRPLSTTPHSIVVTGVPRSR